MLYSLGGVAAAFFDRPRRGRGLVSRVATHFAHNECALDEAK